MGKENEGKENGGVVMEGVFFFGQEVMEELN